MRPIKFRSYDAIEKRMVVLETLDWRWLPKNLMQFTGLTDKNGKEIYEGDVLKDDVGILREVRFGELPLDKSGDCVCTYQAFYAHYEKTVNGRTGYEHECSRIGDWMEVIGNIHEDKDLLK